MESLRTGIAGGRLRINLAAIAANYSTIARRVSPARVAAVVKADAYGLGAENVAPVLSQAGCRLFFVAHLGEAIALRAQLPRDAEIFVLNGLAAGDEADCIAAGVVPVLNSIDQAHGWRQAAQFSDRSLPAIIQVDSGMARLGMSHEEAVSLLACKSFRAAIDVRMIMSHLACADTPQNPVNGAQLERFEAAAALLPGVARSLSNSGGTFLPPSFRGDVVRAGIALYGGAPNQDDLNPMKPVIELEARVIQVRTVEAGTGIGYGHEFHCARESRIATIGVGYADGLPRTLGNRGAAWIAGHRLPIVGRVSMDSMTLDVSALPLGLLSAGSWVELVGPDQSLDTLAQDAGTISYEILTSLGRRYDRQYIFENMGDEAQVR